MFIFMCVSVLKVASTDVDGNTHSHGYRVYSITGGNSDGKFSINPTSGLIEVAAPLDFEDTTSYT